MKVIIESPFAGNIPKNLDYARACMADCFERGEIPFASHLLYTQKNILKDHIPEERALGINAGLEWGKHADKTVVYTDLGITPGMLQGISAAQINNREIVYRRLHSKN
jgi:hypothetical protein